MEDNAGGGSVFSDMVRGRYGGAGGELRPGPPGEYHGEPG